MNIYRKILFRPVFIFFGLIFLIAFSSCDEEKIDPDKYVMSPFIRASREGEQIKVDWYTAFALNQYSTNIYIPNAVSADKYELFISENDTLHFTSLGEIDSETTGYIYPENVSGESYFFRIKNYAKGANPTYSNVAWIIGGENEELNTILDGGDNNSLRLNDLSSNESELIYSIIPDPSSNTWMFSYNLISEVEEELIQGQHACYDNNEDRIAFGSYFEIATTPQPTNLGLMNISTLQFSQITNDDYVVQYPIWSDDDISIYFLNTIDFYSSPWVVQQIGIEKGEISTLITKDEITLSNKPICLNNDKIYLTAIDEKYTESIFSYDIDDEQIEPVEKTIWNEYSPAISNDGQYLAFISSRSGSDEIWVKNLNTDKYWQLTSDNDGDPIDKLVWSNEDSKIFFTGYFEESLKILSVSFNP